MAALSIQDAQAAVVADFARLDDWQARYRKIILTGKAMQRLDDAHKTDQNKVKGCQSQVWLHATLDEGRVIYQGDSDAAIVRGLVALVLQVFSGHTPDEILASEITFINDLGLSDHLTQNRSNGLAAMVKQVKFYAIAFNALLARG